MLLGFFPLVALLAPIVVAKPIANADADALANPVPSLTLTDKTPSIVARAPLQEFTQDLDVNDPGPGGTQEKGGPREKSWIDNMAVAAAKSGGCCVM